MRATTLFDAMNRLVAMETQPVAVAAGVPQQRLEFVYDYQGRRTAKKLFIWDAPSSSWTLISDLRFLYDGFNLLTELETDLPTSDFRLSTSFVWGLDLSGSLQGAGGVGGLLAVTGQSPPPAPSTFIPCFDGNGKVIAYLDLGTDAPVADFEYGPFGETLRATGSFANDAAFRFSTKFTDAETGLCYYGFRYYSPQTGRWQSRDPIEEQGGYNLFGIVSNNLINRVDCLALVDTARILEHILLIQRVRKKYSKCCKVQAFLDCVENHARGDLGSDPLSDFAGSLEASMKSLGEISPPFHDIDGKAELLLDGLDHLVIQPYADSHLYEVVYHGKSLGFIPDRIEADRIVSIYRNLGATTSEALEVAGKAAEISGKMISIGEDIARIAKSENGFDRTLNISAAIVDRTKIPVVADFLKFHAESYAASAKALNSLQYGVGSGVLGGKWRQFLDRNYSSGNCLEAQISLGSGFQSGTSCESLLQ